MSIAKHMSALREGSYWSHVGMILCSTYEPREALFELGETTQRKTNDPSLPPLSPLCILSSSLEYSRTKRLGKGISKREITEVIILDPEISLFLALSVIHLFFK